MSTLSAVRSVHTLTLFMPAHGGERPMTRHEPLRSRNGSMHNNPKTTRGLLAWRAVWVADGRRHVEGPVVLEIYVRVQRPKSHLRVGHGLNTEGKKFPVPTGFDLSNVIKLVEDALKDHAFGDDTLVARLHVTKSWTSPGKQPGVEVSVSRAVVSGPLV